MSEWLIGGLAAVAAFLAWRLRGFFADRAEAKLESQRNTALADAKAQSVKAAAKTVEAAKLGEQQKKEGAIHVASHDDLAARLDALFK